MGNWKIYIPFFQNECIHIISDAYLLIVQWERIHSACVKLGMLKSGGNAIQTCTSDSVLCCSSHFLVFFFVFSCEV